MFDEKNANFERLDDLEHPETSMASNRKKIGIRPQGE